MTIPNYGTTCRKMAILNEARKWRRLHMEECHCELWDNSARRPQLRVQYGA